MGIERSEAALRAIEAVEAAGGTAYYHSLDLRDGAAVAAVVDDIRQRYGKIDVLLHAGGLLIDRTLPNKEPHQFALVFDVKADGFFNLIKAAKGLPIGATVSFSSVAGRFGNNGQSDYASANDLLCKISSSMRTWRPDTRGIAIDWTAWGQIGMASRGSVQQILEALGVDMLPPESGVPDHPPRADLRRHPRRDRRGRPAGRLAVGEGPDGRRGRGQDQRRPGAAPAPPADGGRGQGGQALRRVGGGDAAGSQRAALPLRPCAGRGHALAARRDGDRGAGRAGDGAGSRVSRGCRRKRADAGRVQVLPHGAAHALPERDHRSGGQTAT